MKHLALIVALSLTACNPSDPYMDRGPGGFMTEEMAVDLGSIPHQEVIHFNGMVLVLGLSEADLATLRGDNRFNWRDPKYNGTYWLGDGQFMDGDRFEVVVDEWPKRGDPVLEDWRMFGLDLTRRRIYFSASHWPFFKNLSEEPGQNQPGQPATAVDSKGG